MNNDQIQNTKRKKSYVPEFALRLYLKSTLLGLMMMRRPSKFQDESIFARDNWLDFQLCSYTDYGHPMKA